MGAGCSAFDASEAATLYSFRVFPIFNLVIDLARGNIDSFPS